MSSSIVFTSSGFGLHSVTPLTGKLRVTYTHPALMVSAAGANDSLNVSNYQVLGSPTVTLSSVSAVDSQTVDITLSALAPGDYILAVANVHTPAGGSLTGTTQLPFTLTDSADLTPLTGGAETETPESVIRKHLSSGLRGPNWDALIAALAESDQENFDAARQIFDQMFMSTAGGKYLDALAANEGLQRPAGMSDDHFRDLARVGDEKLTLEAVLDVLEAFYGRDAVRAYDTSIEEPFAITPGQDLTWTLDGDQVFSHVFLASEFKNPGSATAVEVAAALTFEMEAQGSSGFAQASLDSDGLTRVRIYSGTRGLGGGVLVTGGTAQRALRFPTEITTTSGGITTGLGYSWTFSLVRNKTRLLLTTTGIPLIDTSVVQPGDYVVMSPATPAPGSYVVDSVDYRWSGLSWIQTLDLVSDVGYTGSWTQTSETDFLFFRPQDKTLATGTRTAVVARTPAGIDVSVPATPEAVDRTATTAMYMGAETESDSYWTRLADGSVTDTTPDGRPEVLTGDIRRGLGRPWVNSSYMVGIPSQGFSNTRVSNASTGSTWSMTGASVPGFLSPPGDAVPVALGSDSVLLTGGYLGGTVQPSALSIKVSDGPTTSDLSLAPRSICRSTQTFAALEADMNTARWRHGASVLRDGRIMVTGGLDATNSVLSSQEIYDKTTNTWTPVGNLPQGRAYHRQLTLNDGRVLVAGGTQARNNAFTIDIYDPVANTWTSVNGLAAGDNAFAIGDGMEIALLRDGKVLMVGGCLHDAEPSYPNLLARWRLDETAGVAISGAYPLTATAGTTVGRGQVGNARFFSVGQKATGAGDVTAGNALHNGDFTISFWLLDPIDANGAIAPVILSYDDPATPLVTQFRLYKDFTNELALKMGSTQGTPSYSGIDTSVLQDASGNHYIVCRVQVTGGTRTVTWFVDGVQANQTTGAAAPGALTGSEIWTMCNWYTGGIDQVTVETEAVSADTILQRYWIMKGRPGLTSGGILVPYANVFDPTTNSVRKTGQPIFARTGHRLINLDDGRVLSAAGIGYRYTQALAPTEALPGWIYTTQTFPWWPATAIRDTEIWDPATNIWSPGPQLPVEMAAPALAVMPTRSQALLVSRETSAAFFNPIWGNGYTAVAADKVLLVDTKKATVRIHYVNRPQAVAYSALAGDIPMFSGTQDQPLDFAWIPGHKTNTSVDLLSARGIDGVSRSTTSFFNFSNNHSSWATSPVGIASPAADALGGGWVLNNRAGAYELSAMSRTSNIVTATVANNTTLINPDPLAPGDTIYFTADTHATVPGSLAQGVHVVTAVTATTVSWRDPGVDVVSGAVTGSLYRIAPATKVLTESTATNGGWVSNNPSPGPFIQDPDSPTTAGEPLYLQNYPDVGSVIAESGVCPEFLHLRTFGATQVTAFPDGGGWIFINRGTSRECGPLRYIQAMPLPVAGYPLTLQMAPGQQLPARVLRMDSVTRVSSLMGAEPGTEGQAWLTGTPEGLRYAESMTLEVTAAGTGTQFLVRYPGDQGLGNAGQPTTGSGKTSDIIRLWEYP